MLKKILLSIFLCMPSLAWAQLVGIGAEYSPPKNGANAIQFQMNLAFPTWTHVNPLNTVMLSGIDYSGGSSPVSGLNIKPFQFRSYITENLYNNHPYTILLGFDTGYLFNFRHGKDGLILTPNIHLEYKFYYINTGWDFNITGNRNQFYVKFGIGFGLGTFKTIAKTRIR